MSWPAGTAKEEIKGWVHRMAAVSGQWSSCFVWVQGNMMGIHKTEVRTFMPQFKVKSVSILTYDKKNSIFTFVVTTSHGDDMEAITFKVEMENDFSEWYSVLYNNCYASMNEQALMDKADAVGRFTDLLSSGNKELDLTVGMVRFIREKFPSGGAEVNSFLALVAEKKRLSSFADRFKRDTEEQKAEKRWGKLLGLMRETPSVRIISGMNDLGELEEMLLLDMEYFPACTSLMLDFIKFNEVANATHVVNLALRNSFGNVEQFRNVEKLAINRCETFDFSNVYKLSPGLTHLEVHSFLTNMNCFLQDFSPKGMLGTGEVPWHALRVLDVSHNQIKAFPKAMKELIKLEKLIADYNELSTIEHLEGLKKLVYFSARNNYLTNVAAIAVCPQLKYLDLDNNNIRDFPWMYLPNLQKLGISNNDLCSWRDVYIYSSRCDSLKELDIDKNENLRIAIDKSDYADMLRTLFGNNKGLVVNGKVLSTPDKSTIEQLHEKYATSIFYTELVPNQKAKKLNDGEKTAAETPQPTSPLLVQRTVHKKLVVRKKVRRGGSKKSGSKKDSHHSVSHGSQTDGDARAELTADGEVEELPLRDADLDIKRHIHKKKHRRVKPEDKCAEWQKDMDKHIAEGGIPDAGGSPKMATEETRKAVPGAEVEGAVPTPIPEPEDVPEPEVIPVVQAEPEPVPEPVPEAEVVELQPELVQAEELRPEPEPEREPEPEKEVQPVPVPTPEVVRVPTPEVVRVPTPEVVRVPTPEVVRVPTPEVVRVPTPEVVRVPTPEPIPAPEPLRSPTPEVQRVPTPEPQAVPEIMFSSSKQSKMEVDALSFSSSKVSSKQEQHVNFDIPDGYDSGASNEYLIIDENDAQPDDLVHTQTHGSQVEGIMSPELQDVMLKLGAPAIGFCQWWSGGFMSIINWYKKYWTNISRRDYATAQKALVVLCHFHLLLVVPFAVLFITVPTDDDLTFRTFIAVMMVVSSVFQTVFGIMALFYENIVMLISFNLLTIILAVRYIFNTVYYVNNSKSQALIVPPIIEAIYELIYLGVSIVVAPNFNKLVCYRVGGRPHIVAMYRYLQVYSAAVKVDFLFITLSAIISFFYYAETTPGYVLTGVALAFSLLVYTNAISWAMKEKRHRLMAFSGFAMLVFCAQAYMIGYLSESSALRSRLEEALHATFLTILAAVVIKVVMFISLILVVRNFGKGLKESLEVDKTPEEPLWGIFPSAEL